MLNFFQKLPPLALGKSAVKWLKVKVWVLGMVGMRGSCDGECEVQILAELLLLD